MFSFFHSLWFLHSVFVSSFLASNVIAPAHTRFLLQTDTNDANAFLVAFRDGIINRQLASVKPVPSVPITGGASQFLNSLNWFSCFCQADCDADIRL